MLREKSLIKNSEIPISRDNYSALCDHLRKQEISVPFNASIDLVKKLTCHKPRRKKNAPYRELRTASIGALIHHDRNPVFTSFGWTAQIMLNDRARISFALNGAQDTILVQGNPEMEGSMSRFTPALAGDATKSVNKSLLLYVQTLDELKIVAKERMAQHNRKRWHSSISYKAPRTYVATQWLRL